MTDPWFAWELGRAAREARASRTRVLTGMGLLVAAAVAVIVAGVFVDESVFWAAVAPVFAAALTVLVAYGAVRLGVFAHTAELLGRRAERSADSSPMALPDRARLEREMQGQGAYDVGVQLRPKPSASEPPRANLVAALRAFEIASQHGHGEATRQRALLELRLGGDHAQRDAYISLLYACQNGSPVALTTLARCRARS